MKFLNLFTFAISISVANAQTPLIAHKSHSGTSTAFFIDPSSNFGAIRIDPEITPTPTFYSQQRFRPLNDSTMIIERTDFNQQIIQVDTLPNKHRYSDAIFRYQYEDSIRKDKYKRMYEEELKQEQELLNQKKQLELQQQQLNETPKKKEKKSYLLFLFGITGGGMLLMRLFSRSKITKPSISQL